MSTSYTEDYKRDVLELLASSGEGYRAISKRLGVPDSTLRSWYNQKMGRTRNKPRQATALDISPDAETPEQAPAKGAGLRVPR